MRGEKRGGGARELGFILAQKLMALKRDFKKQSKEVFDDVAFHKVRGALSRSTSRTWKDGIGVYSGLDKKILYDRECYKGRQSLVIGSMDKKWRA